MPDSDRKPDSAASKPIKSCDSELVASNEAARNCDAASRSDGVDRNAIPAFDARGLLPSGIHFASDAEFEERFVDAYGYSGRRRIIWNKHSEWRAKVHELGFKGLFWLDGSYVTSKPEPGDIDVATVLDYDSYNEMSVAAQHFAERWMDYGRGQDRYETDARLVFTCPDGHPRKKFLDDLYHRILKLYTHTEEGEEKGLVATRCPCDAALSERDS